MVRIRTRMRISTRIKTRDKDKKIPPSTQRSEMKNFFDSDLSLDTKGMSNVKARQDNTT